MAKILLVDFDEQHAQELATVLQSHGHSTTVLGMRDGVTSLNQPVRLYDVIILDLPANRSEPWQLVQEICRWTGDHLPKPPVLCISRVRWDARTRLEIERR